MAKVIFMGSPEFAVPTLEQLIASSHDVVACFSQPARPKNRGKKLVATEILSLQKNLILHAILQPV